MFLITAHVTSIPRQYTMLENQSLDQYSARSFQWPAIHVWAKLHLEPKTPNPHRPERVNVLEKGKIFSFFRDGSNLVRRRALRSHQLRGRKGTGSSQGWGPIKVFRLFVIVQVSRAQWSSLLPILMGQAEEPCKNGNKLKRKISTMIFSNRGALDLPKLQATHVVGGLCVCVFSFNVLFPLRN